MEPDPHDETLQVRRRAAPRPEPTLRVRKVSFDRARAGADESTSKVRRVSLEGAAGWRAVALLLALLVAGVAAWLWLSAR